MFKRKYAVFLILTFLLGIQSPAWAESVYATSASPNDTVYSIAATADIDGSPPPYLSSVSVSTAGLQAGDTVKVVFYEADNTTLISEVSTTGGTVTAPSNAFYAYLKLTTGSAEGVRYAWFTSATNTWNNTAYFDPPNTSNAGGGGGTTIDLSPIIERLDTIISMLQTGSGGSSGGDLTEIINNLTTIINNQGDMISKFNQISSQLDTSNSHLSVIKSDLSNLKDYIITPRSADDLDTSSLNDPPNFDPTPPPINEPYQPPYNYNRQTPVMPPFEDSPGPLPINPDPVAMPHDPAAIIDNPLQIEKPIARVAPIARDPVNMDDPIIRDPVIKDSPLIRDPVNMDDPITRDPVSKDSPLTRDPVQMDTPIARDPVIQRDSPLSREAPLTRDEPINMDPPITPDPMN